MIWVEGNEPPEFVGFEARMVVEKFRCDLCKLQLDSQQEVEFSELAGEVLLEDADPWDFVPPEEDEEAEYHRQQYVDEMLDRGVDPWEAYD
jgi:hypothetical protein